MSEELIVAIFEGKVERVKELLNKPEIDVNFRYTTKTKTFDKIITPLHMAVLKNDIETVKLLLADERLDANALSGAGRTALHIVASASSGNVEICKLLLPLSNLSTLDQRNQSAYDLASIASKSFSKNNPDLSKRLQEIVELLRLSTFFAACKANIQELVNRIAEEQKISDGDLYRGVQIMIAKRQEILVDYFFRVREFQEILFLYACSNGYLEMVQRLINYGVDVNAAKETLTGLILACKNAHASVVTYLLELPQIQVNFQTDNCFTALHCACLTTSQVPLENPHSTGEDEQADRMHIVNLLVNRGADVNCQNVFEQTPLCAAVIFNQLDLVKLLVLKGANLVMKVKCPEELKKELNPDSDGNLAGDISDVVPDKYSEIQHYFREISSGKRKLQVAEKIAGRYYGHFLLNKSLTSRNNIRDIDVGVVETVNKAVV